MKSEVLRELEELATEARNPKSANIDREGAEGILRIINEEDKLVPLAVEREIPKIAEAVESIVESFREGGRLIYVGAGTSGRLGVLDAAECPPTFSSPPEMVQAIIAGGDVALRQPVEGAEDSQEAGADAIARCSVSKKDAVVGICASGRTPFVIGALEKANELGARTIALTTNPGSKITKHAKISIAPDVGPEVIAGSTRMKSGTAQKLVLNMLTTASMILMGKVYGNFMVDLKPLSEKLRERAKGIIMVLTGASYEEASRVYEETGEDVKLSILAIKGKLSLDAAKALLQKANGRISLALDYATKGRL
ncbi:MAG: N-acetylmuramic acid 6-phosphate etherase [Candidatus Brockarchaeota archaeon]|nr:N-acetylmuramic acid 6-phosphate etherase [Candidatus Brockarchaeota archaeon]